MPHPVPRKDLQQPVEVTGNAQDCVVAFRFDDIDAGKIEFGQRNGGLEANDQQARCGPPELIDGGQRGQAGPSRPRVSP